MPQGYQLGVVIVDNPAVKDVELFCKGCYLLVTLVFVQKGPE